MEIPSAIKLGGHVIEVRCVDSSELPNPADYNSWYQVIRINTDSLPEDRQAEALLHEIIEAVNMKNDLDLGHEAISTLSEWLFAVMRDNKLTFAGDPQ